MPALGAVAIEAGLEVRALDCMAEQMGWATLRKVLAEKCPSIVCLGEAHALFIDESLKLVQLIREVSPHTLIIAGGGHFATQWNELMQSHPIDFLVIGEGENTLRELLRALVAGSADFSSIPGMVFRKTGQLIKTAPRALIPNLDDLPMPAFDLMPMHKYGTAKYLFSPDGTTIEHSRGCIFSCDFCVWWVQMADRQVGPDDRESLAPRWRTKSAQRTVDELELLNRKYKKECFIFVDGTWNVDADWNRAFAHEILRRGLKINWFAFVRADYLIRDEKLGILADLVRSGLSHICIGVEHYTKDFLASLGKKKPLVSAAEEAIQLLKRKYPQVFIQSTFIVGSENETRESMQQLGEYARGLGVDFPAFHILTPVPGTSIFEQATREKRIEVTDFSKYDWNTPIMRTRALSRSELLHEAYVLYRKSVKITWLLKGLFSPYPYKRNMYIWWLITTARVVFSDIFRFLRSPHDVINLVEPSWYRG